MAGRLEGADAGRLGGTWDSKFQSELKEQISTQQKFHWTGNATAAPGKEKPLPAQFWTHYDPRVGDVLKSNISDDEWTELCASEKKNYTPKAEDIAYIREFKHKWLANTEAKFVKRNEWTILLSIVRGLHTQKEITEKFAGGLNRDKVGKICEAMVKAGRLVKDGTKYFMSDTVRTAWFELNPRAIGTAEDIVECTERCVMHHLARGHFIAMADQTVNARDRTDLVAYDYEKLKSISIEIESASEVKSHPEQVTHNMLKWPELKLHKCEVWSFNPKIVDLYNKLVKEENQKQTLGEPNNVNVLKKVTIHVLTRRDKPKETKPQPNAESTLVDKTGEATQQPATKSSSDDKAGGITQQPATKSSSDDKAGEASQQPATKSTVVYRMGGTAQQPATKSSADEKTVEATQQPDMKSSSDDKTEEMSSQPATEEVSGDSTSTETVQLSDTGQSETATGDDNVEEPAVDTPKPDGDSGEPGDGPTESTQPSDDDPGSSDQPGQPAAMTQSSDSNSDPMQE